MSRKQKKFTLTSEFVEAPAGAWNQVIVDEDWKPVLLSGWEGLTWKLMKLLEKIEAEKRLREGAENDNVRTIVRTGEV